MLCDTTLRYSVGQKGIEGFARQPYAGKLHVRFDEGEGVPCGGAPLYSTKLQYANVRVTMSKTPSDYGANLNNGSEIANRCF